jgi:hypothetical protein
MPENSQPPQIMSEEIDKQTAPDRPVAAAAPCCASLEWYPGPANGGGGTAQESSPNGDPWWRDGDLLLVIVDCNDGPEVSAVRVHADGSESLDFSNAASGDFDFGWTDRDISWWARLDGVLPPNATDETRPH